MNLLRGIFFGTIINVLLIGLTIFANPHLNKFNNNYHNWIFRNYDVCNDNDFIEFNDSGVVITLENVSGFFCKLLHIRYEAFSLILTMSAIYYLAILSESRQRLLINNYSSESYESSETSESSEISESESESTVLNNSICSELTESYSYSHSEDDFNNQEHDYNNTYESMGEKSTSRQNIINSDFIYKYHPITSYFPKQKEN